MSNNLLGAFLHATLIFLSFRRRTTGTTKELAEKVNAFMYRPTNQAYGKGIDPPSSTYMQAFNKKKEAKSMHLFYAKERTKPQHLALEKQIERLNDTKDLVSEMPRRGSLTEAEYQEHLKEETYNPKPTIFPIRGEPTVPSPTSQKENQPAMYDASKKKKSVVSWDGYQPKHAGTCVSLCGMRI